MARKPRSHSGLGVYHVILRGNNKQNLFYEDKDRLFFLKQLHKYSNELNIHIYAYCLMSNHVHILIGNAEPNMSLLIQKLANSYVYFFNHKYERCGHLFQDRFKSEAILDDEYFKTVYRYILQNSEKAGMGSCDEYRWNSYGELKNNSASTITEVDYVVGIFGSVKATLDFLACKEKTMCMEFENRFIISDRKALCIIKRLLRIKNPHVLERLNVGEQRKKCHLLKEEGLSISQISRLTGISKSIIRCA